MNTRFKTALVMLVSALLTTGCAVSPEAEERRQAIDASIAEILSQPIDVDTYAEPRRCLSSRDFRSYRALNNQYMLFVGRRGQQWVNRLRSSCFDLDRGDVLITRSLSSNRICERDTFEVADWFSWPWYRRYPWQWGIGLGAGGSCMLGEFHPVTDEQVREIEAVIENP
ncbi:MAG: DUF6491 family protein [Woeseiaceae bacterium]|nr:DUF6491 family protein [Woeseiaceae bacterium]